MANAHLAYPDLAIDKLSGTDLDQDAESFIQLIERKINFALGDAPGDAGELANYTFRKKALFSSLLRGPAAEWYESNITNATTWDDVRTNFITRFSDGRNKFRHRMEMEHCIRGDGEEIRNFLHCIKRTVDKGWPDDLNGVAAVDQAAELIAQRRQRRQRYIDYSLKGLRPKYLQRKAQEYLMENPNATWNDFSARIIQTDVSFQVSSSFINDEEQTKAQIATLGQEMKNLRSELLEHRVNAVEGNSRTADPNQKGRQNATRFCNYCRTNGHTPSWCRNKIRDEELKRIESERTAEKKVTFTQDYNKKRGPDHGSEQWTRGQDFQRKNQNFTNDRFRRGSPNGYQNFSPRPNFTNRNNGSNDRRSFDQRPNQSFNGNDGNRSRHESFNNQNGNWRHNGNFSRSPSNLRRDFSQINSYRQPRNDQPNNFAFRRSDNRPTANFTPYELKFPQNNNQTPSNVVRFTTTDDTINELSDLCPLNY